MESKLTNPIWTIYHCYCSCLDIQIPQTRSTWFVRLTDWLAKGHFWQGGLHGRVTDGWTHWTTKTRTRYLYTRPNAAKWNDTKHANPIFQQIIGFNFQEWTNQSSANSHSQIELNRQKGGEERMLHNSITLWLSITYLSAGAKRLK